MPFRSVCLGLFAPALLAAGCMVVPNVSFDPDGGTASGTSSASSSSGGGAGGVGGTGGTSASSSSSSSSSSSGTGGGPPACTVAESDEFEGPAISSCWKPLHQEAFVWPPTLDHLGMTPQAGELTLRPFAANLNAWFGEGQGPLLYQEVTGDFVFAVGLRASASATHDLPPSGQYNVAGVVVREPLLLQGHENWVLMDIGYQWPMEDGIGLGLMLKKTIAGYSTKTPVGTNDMHVVMGVCRRNQQFTLLHRIYDDPDTMTFVEESPIPEWSSASNTLQVGLTVGTWTNQPNVAGHFSYFRLDQKSPGKTCMQAFQDLIAKAP